MPLAGCTIQKRKGRFSTGSVYGRGVEAMQAECARHRGEILENRNGEQDVFPKSGYSAEWYPEHRPNL